MKLFELNQPQTTHAVFTFGRLNPPHYGHHAMINTLQKVAKEKNGNWFLFVSSKQEPEKNPLTYEQKVAWIKALFPETVGHLVEDPTIKTPLVAATWLYKQGYRSITFVAGEDDMESYSKMIQSGNEHGKKNPQAVEQGKGFIFDPIDFAISPRLASATNARAAVTNGDKEAFARAILGPKITDPKLLDAVEDKLYPTVRKAMNLGESKNLKKKLLDKPTPTVAELAKKYNVSSADVQQQLDKGIKVELEHTNDRAVAKEIALDHINEKLDYYKELAKIEESETSTLSTADMLDYLRKHHDPNLHSDYTDYITKTFAKFELKNVPVNSIKTELPGLDRSKVERYKAMDFSKAPPIVIGNGFILDGYHRATVAKALGIPTIKAYVGIKNQTKLQETEFVHINQEEEGGSLEGYVVDSSAPQLANYLSSQGADPKLAQAIANKFPTIAIIRNMYVDEEQRGQGIGSQLLESAIDEAFSRGADAIILVADMAEDNQAMGKPLDQWYASYGFKKVGMAGTDPVMILTKDLSENFADGKGPGRPGDSRRHGIPKKASIAQLEKHAKRPGRAGQLARWQLNMRRGKKKANEDIVDEASMSAGALADFAKSPLAQSMSVGFEAEMVYPNVSSDRKGEGDKPDFSLDQPLPVRIGWRDDITDFFTEGDRPNSLVTVSRVVDDLRDSYATWCEEGFEYWIKTNEGKELAEKNDISHSDVLAAYKDDSTYLQHIALNRLLRIYAEQKSTIKEYLNERGWTSMKDVWELYKRYLHWPYTLADEEENSSDISPNGLARSLAKSLNVKSLYNADYHGAERDGVTWIFEPDSSIKVGESGEGLELVSPPMPFALAMKKLDEFFKWAKSNNAYTNKSTGFHVGVSIPKQTMQNIDHLKLILFLGDQYVLAQFGRSFNSYTESYYKKITDFLELGVGGDIAPLLDSLRQGIDSFAFKMLKEELIVFKDRYVSVNIKGSYIEFRSAGGDYVNDFDKIKNTILRYVRVMGIAADPEAYKNEYATKTYKLLSAGVKPDENNQPVKLFDMYVAGLITRSELKDKLRLTQAKRQAQKGTIPGEGPDGPGTYLVTYSYVVTANGQQRQHTSTRKASDRKSAVNQVLEILATIDGISNYKIIKADRLILKEYKVTYKGDSAYIDAQNPADAIAKARTYGYFGTGSSVPNSEFTVELYSKESKNSTDSALNETLKKVKDKWALVSRSNPKKVLQYYKGSGHPSKDWISKVERRVHSFESAEEKVQPIIYLDMDGVLADFFGEWAKLDGKDHYKDIDNKEATIQMVREHPTFWVDLPVLPRARELIKLVLKHYGEYRICTKPLEGDPRCKEGKLQWIKDNLSDIPPKEVVFSYNKEEHALKNGVSCVLVDDYGKNINAWRAAGGIGLKYETDNHDKVAEILVKLARSGVVK